MASNLALPSWPVSWAANLNAEFSHKASEAAFEGDLAWYDAANHCLRSANTFTDAGVAAGTQQAFAAVFAGVFASKQLSTDATGRNARVVTDYIWEYPCASSTFAVGDFVTPTYTGGVLSAQQLTKTTDPVLAIGRVVKEYQSATTKVKVRLTATQLVGVTRFDPALDSIIYPINFTATDATRVLFPVTRAIRLKSGSSTFTTASTSGTWTVEKLTGTTAPGGGTALFTAPVALSGAANTPASGTLIATAASLTFAPGDRVGLVIAGTMTNLVGGVGQLTFTPA
jgi:hypothetical protein